MEVSYMHVRHDACSEIGVVVASASLRSPPYSRFGRIIDLVSKHQFGINTIITVNSAKNLSEKSTSPTIHF